MTSNLQLKNLTCQPYIFERLPLYFSYQINNFIVVLIETVGQKTKIRDSKTSSPKIQESRMQRNTRKQDFETHLKRLRDFEIGTKNPETLDFLGTLRHPYKWKLLNHMLCDLDLHRTAHSIMLRG